MALNEATVYHPYKVSTKALSNEKSQNRPGDMSRAKCRRVSNVIRSGDKRENSKVYGGYGKQPGTY